MRGSCYEFNSCGYSVTFGDGHGHCVSGEHGAVELFLFCFVLFGSIKNKRV
jgi:hypothetical protein